MQAALATMPADTTDDDEVLAPGAGETSHTPNADRVEFIDDDEEVSDETPAAVPDVAAKTTVAPKPKKVEPAAAPSIEQPLAPEADPWAETTDVEYTDGDTGEKYTVRAPKSYADKIKNGYARRSIMDRNSGYLSKHKGWIEPLIENKQFDDVAPVIQRAIIDPDFADYIASAYMRRMNGLPLNIEQRAALASAADAAPAVAAKSNRGSASPESMLAALDNDDTIDDYTKGALRKALAPFADAYASTQSQLADAQAYTQRQYQNEQSQAQQAELYDRQRRTGEQGRQALMRVLPDEYNETTPREKWMQVMEYISSSNMFAQYGEGPSTFVLAAQAIRSPLGLSGIGRPAMVASSPAAQTIAEVRAQGERLAATATSGVARSTAARAPGGVDTPAPVKKATPPRYVKTANGGKRPASPREIALWFEKHPEAL